MTIDTTISPLRLRMIEDMTARKLGPHSQRSQIHSCRRFAAFLKRSPDTATADDVRRFHYGLFANGNRTANIARLRELLSVPPIDEAEEEASSDDQRQLPCPCPRCGGRMIIIETFAAGMQPTSSPAPPPNPIRVDTS